MSEMRIRSGSVPTQQGMDAQRGDGLILGRLSAPLPKDRAPAFFIGNAAVVGRALLDRPLLHRAAGRAGRLAAETAEDDREEAVFMPLHMM